MGTLKYLYYCTYIFIYSISSDMKNPKLDSKLHSAVVGISLVIFFIIFGIYCFFLSYIHKDINISKPFFIICFVFVMILNGIYAIFNSRILIKHFNHATHDKIKVMSIGGFISISSFLFMFAAATTLRAIHHVA